MSNNEIVDPGKLAHANKEKNIVAFSSVLAAIFLTLLKLVVGISTGSLGILSEAAHSGLDLVAAFVTLFAVRVSSKPADELHTYGHGKVENLSALIETILLLATCAWIIFEAIQRLFFRDVQVELSIWAFVIVIVAIIIDWTRSNALARVAKKYDSQALEADALHFSTDIWSSLVVLVGLFCVLMAKMLAVSWLMKADAVAALGVSGIVIHVSIQLGKRTISALIDGIPASLRDRLTEAVHVPGITKVNRVRIRRSGPETFADVNIEVLRNTSLVRAHDIASTAEEAVKRIMPGTDVVVHIDPGTVEQEGIVDEVQVIAGQHDFAAHGIRLYSTGEVRELELHLEVPEKLSLAEAHDRASEFEQALRKSIPSLMNIVTHIEPAGDLSALRQATKSQEFEVIKAVQKLPIQMGVNCEPHQINVHRAGNELAVSFHCVLDPALSITEVHDFTERAERLLRSEMPVLRRVVIHTEPSAKFPAKLPPEM